MSKVPSLPDVGEAFAILRKEIQNDPSYAYGWHANIAMAMFDVMPETFWMPDKSKYKKFANEGASAFMKRVFDVETSQDMLLNEKD